MPIRTSCITSLLFCVVACAPLLRAQTAPSTQSAHLDVRAIDHDRMINMANGFLNQPVVTVTASHSPRSAGGEHDFFSEADYFWPDPKNPDGPYINRDGMTNPNNFNDHRNAMFNMSVYVATLTAAYELSHDQRYADAAVKHLHAWFVDPATLMNPNLQYAQAVHGKYTGRNFGIIDTIHLMEVAQSCIVLERDGQLKEDNLKKTKKWFADYIDWLRTSQKGIDEMNTKNNHATCWAMQTAAFARFVGDEQTLEFIRDRYKNVLLPNQMGPLEGEDGDLGSFPLELKRTKPYGYSIFNLDAMCTVCELASTPSDNLWTYATPDGKTIRAGTEYLFPYLKDKKTWPKKPDVMFYEFWPVRSASMLFAGENLSEQKYLDLWKSLPADYSNPEVLRNVPIRTPVIWEH